MASTLTVSTPRGTDGNRRKVYGTINLGSYATNGVAVTARQFGLKTIDFVQFETLVNGTTFVYDRTNLKVKAFVAAGTEVPNATDLSGASSTLRFMVVGR